ncbi:molybdenum cofactor guanylyltransferase [Halobacillus sp. A5]|uniref:molybdenum cofactor guanylyltransferase n=1 Tax=Halobacillus sp. A5 TaxID=2880263 RepID=UPI0020A6C5C3|nr:molybdenum cofactor guanylyltransferase [Halobacillus sp. A5]MCP3025910.1 molybdenum cofactor guanylyltransferase [Halobacillus sp. A5]
MENVSGAILAGGGSTRMGRDKAGLSLGDRSVIESIYRVMSQAFSNIIINRSRPLTLNAVYIEDYYKQHGPLGGLHAVLSSAGSEYVYVTACDTPFIQGEVIQFLRTSLTPGIDAVVPVYEKRVQPLAGIYHTRVEKYCAQLLEEGERKMQSLLDQINVLYVADFPGISDSNLCWHFFNMNSREDYRTALEKIRTE